MNRIMAGGIGGLAATGAMSAVLAGAKSAGLLEVPPPKQITKNVARQIHVNPRSVPRPALQAGWIASHFAYGTACGVVYEVVRPFLPAPSVATGTAYGLAVWAVSYFGLLPSMGLYPPPEHDSASRQAVMVAGHVVYGGLMGLVADRLDPFPKT